MKKILLLFILLATVTFSGCVARKIPGKDAFYSTKSPSLTVRFNDLKYQGEYKSTIKAANIHTCFYADPKGDKGAWIEIIDVRQGWDIRPKRVPGKHFPNTGVFTRKIAGEDYYGRSFMILPDKNKRSSESLPDYTAVRIYTKLISTKKKISIGFAEKIDPAAAKKIFSHPDYKDLTKEQKDFFAAFGKRADSALTLKKFQKGDINDEIKSAVAIKAPWYKSTDFMPIAQQVGKVQR
ncbi:hypothetical protein [Maridesulfovibrio sp.]|uniref:hypothetical protein n=1 Tax=Maridesulfovibrio sp. TaxID=2795000 RepID=UPI0029F462B8|nr:hypothetical protein [Maridesulfovibrio sp.]